VTGRHASSSLPWGGSRLGAARYRARRAGRRRGGQARGTGPERCAQRM